MRDSLVLHERRDKLQTVSAPASGRRPTDLDLSVRIGSLLFSNPVIAASGTFGYGIEFAHLVDLNALGGIVVKGLSAKPIGGAPMPRLCETASGMLNAVGLQNVGVRAFVADKLPELRKYRTPLIANVFGHTIAEYCEVIDVLESTEGIAAYELNISCPNVDCGGAEFGSTPARATEIVSAVRRKASRPLWVKLAPNADVLPIARAVEQAGADALTVANTYPAMSLDPGTGQSKLGRTSGGLSGPAIKPLTLKLVYDTSRAASIPIIGLGGIQNGLDAIEYLRAGATAIQVGTAHFSDPRASVRVVDELRHHISRLSISTISSLREPIR